VTTTHSKAAKFCSRSCASKGSMTRERREAQHQAGLRHTENLLTAAEVLKRREAWKYTACREVLESSDRDYEFEFELCGYVFDLALHDAKVLVEFDGPYHDADNWQRERDKAKDRVAKDAGFVIVRRTVEPMAVVHPSAIEGL